MLRAPSEGGVSPNAPCTAGCTGKRQAAAADIRTRFKTEYGLANRRIAADGVDVFVMLSPTSTD
jgi:hypothetical protein